MLKNVKTPYFLRIIFSLMSEKQKLKLIKYNKILQEKLLINLFNYKFYSKRYIIYETNRKGKEYNFLDNNLIFEGEYLYGERNGVGKEYYDTGEIKFESEYLNGKKNGKGKEYSKDGILIFEGDFLNGKRNGKGKGYYINGLLQFEGEYKNNEEYKGKFYDLTGHSFEMNEKNYITHNHIDNLETSLELLITDKSRCIYIHENGCFIEYEGEFLNGKKNGKGKEYLINSDHDLFFEGEYLNGLRNGKGKEFYDNGTIKFEGEYLNGLRHGKGKEYNYLGKLLFEGEYLYNYKLKGKNYVNEKLEYEGEYLFRKYNGKGYDENGNIIYELKNGTGKVKEYIDNGDLILFEGEYLNGFKHGKGKEYSAGSLIFEGEYLNGLRNGKGKEYYNTGNLRFEGEYLNGKRLEGN